MWLLKSCFHGAGGSADAEGVVCDIVRRKRERRRAGMREAMVAVLRLRENDGVRFAE